MKRIIPLVLLMALLFSGCGHRKEAAVTEAVKPAPAQEVYVMAGKVDAKTQSTVTTKIAAKVAQINVDVGSQVKQGDPIIILDTNDIRAQVSQAEAGVATAQANLSKTLAGSRENQIAQAQANLEGAAISYNNSKKNFDRIKELYNQQALPLLQYETAQTQLAAAEAQYKSAQEQLIMLKQGETKETVNILKSQVQQLSNGTIVAPISGMVIAKNINVGELASPGATLVTIVNNENLCVDAYLPASLMGKVKPGQAVTVKVSEIPDRKFDGQVAVINSVINSLSKNVLVKVVLLTGKQELKPGMFAEIALKK